MSDDDRVKLIVRRKSWWAGKWPIAIVCAVYFAAMFTLGYVLGSQFGLH